MRRILLFRSVQIEAPIKTISTPSVFDVARFTASARTRSPERGMNFSGSMN